MLMIHIFYEAIDNTQEQTLTTTQAFFFNNIIVLRI